MKKDTKTKKSTVPMSLCIRTHDQLILPIFGPILTSSSRAQSTIYFCTLSIRHLINSTPKSTTFYSSPAGYFGICEMKFQKIFNGWFKPPLPTVKIFLVDIDVKKKRKKCLCANMLRPEMSLDRIASKSGPNCLLSVDRDNRRSDWFTFHLRRRDQNEYSSSQKVKLLNCLLTLYH